MIIILVIVWLLALIWPLKVQVCRPPNKAAVLRNVLLQMADNSPLNQSLKNVLVFSKWPKTTLKYVHENWTTLSYTDRICNYIMII